MVVGTGFSFDITEFFKFEKKAKYYYIYSEKIMLRAQFSMKSPEVD